MTDNKNIKRTNWNEYNKNIKYIEWNEYVAEQKKLGLWEIAKNIDWDTLEI